MPEGKSEEDVNGKNVVNIWGDSRFMQLAGRRPMSAVEIQKGTTLCCLIIGRIFSLKSLKQT